jgi:hypothetical protein
MTGFDDKAEIQGVGFWRSKQNIAKITPIELKG